MAGPVRRTPLASRLSPPASSAVSRAIIAASFGSFASSNPIMIRRMMPLRSMMWIWGMPATLKLASLTFSARTILPFSVTGGRFSDTATGQMMPCFGKYSRMAAISSAGERLRRFSK